MKKILSCEALFVFTVYDHLKNIYKFIPKLITYDFSLSNTQAINIVFNSTEIEIIPVLFQVAQCKWKKVSY